MPEQEIPTRPNSQEIPISEVSRGIAANWRLATWLGARDKVDTLMVSGGKSGITRQDLKGVEKVCLRETTSDTDPPIHFLYEREADSDVVTFSVARYSKTEDSWETVLAVSGRIGDDSLSISTEKDQRQVLEATLPLLEKVANHQGKLARMICEESYAPNRLLSRYVFATYPEDTYWLQFDSPVSTIEKDEPLYRLYFNPQIKDLNSYERIAKAIIGVAREYPEAGLHFKMMYGGDGAEKVVLDPASTKIVFYFEEKQKAKVFADYLEQACVTDEVLSLVSPEGGHEANQVPQKSWRNGLITLGKGYREMRQDILRRARYEKMTPEERSRLLEEAKLLSVLIGQGFR